MKKLILFIGLILMALTIDLNAQCTSGNCHNGKGKFEFENGDSYSGSWQDGKPNGAGTYEFSNGDRYVGEFKDGKFDGDGTYTWKDKSKYKGNWVAGKRDGYGKFTWPTGYSYFGKWVADAIEVTEVGASGEAQQKPSIKN